MGLLRIRESVAGYYNRKFNIDLGAGQVIITSGTSPAMLMLFMGLLDKGDEVVMSNPYYSAHPNFHVNLKPLFGKVSTLSKKFGSVKHKHVCRTDKRLAKIDGLVNEALDEAGY